MLDNGTIAFKVLNTSTEADDFGNPIEVDATYTSSVVCHVLSDLELRKYTQGRAEMGDVAVSVSSYNIPKGLDLSLYKDAKVVGQLHTNILSITSTGYSRLTGRYLILLNGDKDN